MDRKILFGALIIVIFVGIVGILLNLPEKQVGCKSGDTQCPSDCTYANDRDCPRTAVTTSGEIKRCLADSDCVIVKPICGNERCNFNDIDCETSCSCEIAINKDYKTVFESASVKCLGSQACAVCQSSSKSICVNGECRMQSI